MKPSGVGYIQNEYPLVDNRLTRGHCLEWMADKGFPKPTKSACGFCPYKSHPDWSDTTPEDLEIAIELDEFVRDRPAPGCASQQFIHFTKNPLRDADLSASTQIDLFNNECEGMCGV